MVATVLGGVSLDYDQASQAQRRVVDAACSSPSCGQCGRALTSGEAVWRVPLRVAGEWTARAQTWLVPVCAGCRPWTRDTLRPEPCQGCGRGVVAAAHEYWPWAGQVFCSDYCAAQWWDAQRVTGVAHVHPGARPEAERHVDAGCVVCGRAVASHHVTCSGACRQRLYRSRKRGLLAILGATRR